MENKYTVKISNRTQKMIKKLPKDIQDVFTVLVLDIEKNGAIRSN